MTPRHAPITCSEFNEWLKSQGRRAVGWAGSYDDCPLARAIIDKGEYVPGAFHGTHAILYKPGGTAKYASRMKFEWIYPVWACDFVEALDVRGDVVTGEEALGCLRRQTSGAGEAERLNGAAVY